VLVGAGGALALVGNPLGGGRPDLVLHTVKRERLDLTIIERGALESARNSDIYCRVKAGNKGSTVSTTIKTLIDDGSEVHGPRYPNPIDSDQDKINAAGALLMQNTSLTAAACAGYLMIPPSGDLLVDLDDSGLLEQLKTQKITVDKAESDKIQAEEAYNITVSQNNSDIMTAETKVELAIIDLMKYTGLDKDEVLKPQTLERLKRQLKSATANARRAARDLAEEDLKQYHSGDYLAALKDILGQIENAQSDLSQQEDREAWAYRMMKKGYQTASQAQAETSRKESFQLTVNKVSLQLDVLVKYTKISQLTGYITALEEAQRTLERTRAQAKSKTVQGETSRSATKSVWEQEVARYRDIEDEIRKCKIYAPQDGMVVYFVPEQARGGGGSQQSIVAQGEPVREGQKLMQIPDLHRMLVNTKVHEALISRVHAGQKAQVRIESFPDRVFRGRVDSVSTVAAQQDWLSADVKVYTTKVAIDPEDVKGINLKPGMSAAVTIYVSDAVENALTVPIQAVVGGPEMGVDRKVVVLTPEGPRERSVVIGASNQTMAEVKEGLNEGDQVVLNPKAVLGEKIKVRQPGVDSGPQATSPGSKDTSSAPASSKPAGDRPAAKKGGGQDWSNMTEEQKQQRMQRFQQKIEEYRKASPEERKKKLAAEPERGRDRIKQALQQQGIEIPD
jgi:multidrug resistance efflux pump